MYDFFIQVNASINGSTNHSSHFYSSILSLLSGSTTSSKIRASNTGQKRSEVTKKYVFSHINLLLWLFFIYLIIVMRICSCLPNLSELRNLRAVGPVVLSHVNSGDLYLPFPPKSTRLSGDWKIGLREDPWLTTINLFLLLSALINNTSSYYYFIKTVFYLWFT